MTVSLSSIEILDLGILNQFLWAWEDREVALASNYRHICQYHTLKLPILNNLLCTIPKKMCILQKKGYIYIT